MYASANRRIAFYRRDIKKAPAWMTLRTNCTIICPTCHSHRIRYHIASIGIYYDMRRSDVIELFQGFRF